MINGSLIGKARGVIRRNLEGIKIICIGRHLMKPL